METILEILKNYWKEIISVVLFIVSVTIAAIRKKPVNDVLTYIYDVCLKGVIATEGYANTSLRDGIVISSVEKKKYCIDFVKRQLLNIFPNLDVKHYEVVISVIIESILETPNKKEIIF